MDGIKVSIAMATYNGAAYLGEQLDSIRRQTFLPVELIICDDGSTDDTLAVARRFAAEAPFKVTIDPHGLRLGYDKNFFRAIGQCTGEVVALCDQDDVWDPRKLAMARAQFRDSAVMAVSHRVQVVDAQLNPTPLVLPPAAFHGKHTLFTVDPWFGPNGMQMLFRRAPVVPWLDKKPPLSKWSRLGTPFDEWIFYLATLTGSVVLLREVLGLWRRHGASTTGSIAEINGANSAGRHWELALSSGAKVYEDRAEISDSRADFAAQAATAPAETTGPVVEGAVEFYRSISRSLRRRAHLHDPGLGIFARQLAFARMCGHRDYRRRSTGGLGGKALLKDFYTLFLGPRRKG